MVAPQQRPSKNKNCQLQPQDCPAIMSNNDQPVVSFLRDSDLTEMKTVNCKLVTIATADNVTLAETKKVPNHAVAADTSKHQIAHCIQEFEKSTATTVTTAMTVIVESPTAKTEETIGAEAMVNLQEFQHQVTTVQLILMATKLLGNVSTMLTT